MIIILCDECGARVMGGVVFKRDGTTDDFCSRACADGSRDSDECPHEDNIDGTTNSTPSGQRRLVCRLCGYDRVEGA